MFLHILYLFEEGYVPRYHATGDATALVCNGGLGMKPPALVGPGAELMRAPLS